MRERTGLLPRQHLRDDVLRVAAGVTALLGCNIGLGALLLQQWTLAAISLALGILGALVLLRRRPPSLG